MKHFQRILVATDTRLESHPIVDEAAEIARHTGATLKIVDVVPEFSWAVRMTLKDCDHVYELMEQEKREALEAMAEPIRAKGIAVETRVLHGKTSVQIIREVLRDGHDLVLRVAKGRDSRRSGYFGTTGYRLLRECPCAVWLVTPDPTPRLKHVLACVETSSDDPADAQLNHQIHELASMVSRYHDARLSVLHAWSVFGEEFLRGRSPQGSIPDIVKQVNDRAKSTLNEFLQAHGGSAGDENVHLIKGDASAVIPAFASQRGVDLVVMGTVARSGAVGMIIGNTAERILSRLECSVLALKPDGFVSPITPG